MKTLTLAFACLFISAALSAEETRRIALVIGNNAYDPSVPADKPPNLTNAVNDARLVAATLKAAGFEVITKENASVESTYEAIDTFKRQGAGASLGLIYYSGHGLEVGGQNYLVPVDAKLETDAQLRTQAISLKTLLEEAGAAGVTAKMIVLDCCRDNPLTGRSWRRARSGGSAAGLVEVGDRELPQATMVMFSAGPGQQAQDGTGANSPFTEAFTKAIGTPGINCMDAFFQASDAVKRATGYQEPWIKFDGAGRTFREFSFLKGSTPITITAKTAPSAPVMPVIPPRQEPITDDYQTFAGRTPGEKKLIEVAAGVSIPFRWCPPGTFTMGSPPSEHAKLKAVGQAEDFYSDEVQHQVTLTKGFWLAETEVTQGQWQAVMNTTLLQQARNAITDDTLYDFGGKKQTWRDWAGATKDTDPASRIGAQSEKIAMYFINHGEAEDWCAKASRHAGQRGWAITLPTEAQWEYACRSGTSGMTYAGDFTIKGANNAPGLDAIAWYGGNSSEGYNGTGWSTSSWKEKQYPGGTAGPRRVGTKQANEWGLCDMIGNVWEWCPDYYGPYATGSVTDPQGATTGAGRVFRGGSWGSDAAGCRAALRGRLEPGHRDHFLGFRPALVPSR